MITDTERQQVFDKIYQELCRSIAKHGDWADYSYWKMHRKIRDELSEAKSAIMYNDIHGEHGVYAETAQVAACAIKLMVQVLRRQV